MPQSANVFALHPQMPGVTAPQVMYIWVQSQVMLWPQVEVAPQASPLLREPHACLVQHAF